MKKTKELDELTTAVHACLSELPWTKFGDDIFKLLADLPDRFRKYETRIGELSGELAEYRSTKNIKRK